MKYKNMLMTTAALACMAFAGTCSAASDGLYRDANGDLHYKNPTPPGYTVNTSNSGGLYRDADGVLHYKMCKEGKSLMKAEDMTANGYWIVPPNVLAMKGDAIPVHEVLGLTEEEAMEYDKGEGGNRPWKRNDEVIVPVHEILDITEEEAMEYDKGEGGNMPNRFVKPGDGYNPATWGYTPKAPITERIQKLLNEK